MPCPASSWCDGALHPIPTDPRAGSEVSPDQILRVAVLVLPVHSLKAKKEEKGSSLMQESGVAN